MFLHVEKSFLLYFEGLRTKAVRDFTDCKAYNFVRLYKYNSIANDTLSVWKRSRIGQVEGSKRIFVQSV